MLNTLRETLLALLQLLSEACAATGLCWPDTLASLEKLQDCCSRWTFIVFGLPLDGLCQRFAGLYVRATRVLRPGYWRDRRILQECYRDRWAFKVPDLAAELAALTALKAELMPHGAKAPDDDLSRPYLDRLPALLSAATEAVDYLQSVSLPEAFIHTAPRVPLNLLLTWCQSQLGALPAVEPYLIYAHEHDVACAAGLGPFIDAALEEHVPAAVWPDVYFRAFYESWLDRAYAGAPELAFFSRDTHEKRIAHFRELDRAQLEIARGDNGPRHE